MLFTCSGCRKKEIWWNRSGNGEFHVFHVDFPFSRGKTRKPRSRTSRWTSRNVEKVLCLISNPSGCFGPVLDFSKNTHFWWKWGEFHHISWKWSDFPSCSVPWGGNGALAAPERKHQRNLSFSYTFWGVRGTKKCVSGRIFTKNAVPGAFLVKLTKMAGIPRNPTIFTKFPTSARSPRPGPPRGLGICKYYHGFCKVRRGEGNITIPHILSWVHIFSS